MADEPPFDPNTLPLPEDVSVSEFETPNPDNVPKKSRRTKTREPRERPKLPPKRKGQFVQPLTQLYAGIGGGLYTFDQECGSAVLKSAEQCAISLDDLAYQNDSVRRALLALTQGSAWGSVLIAHAPIIMTVMQHHAANALPPIVRNLTTDQVGNTEAGVPDAA